jgi:hypothetical protein
MALGGPVPSWGPSTWDRKLPATALPWQAHFYSSDAVSPNPAMAIASVHTTPSISNALSNGSLGAIQLEMQTPYPLPTSPARSALSVEGQLGFPSPGLLQLGGPLSLKAAPSLLGGICRISEQGSSGDGSFIYTGVIEGVQDIVSPTATKHIVQLSPVAFELDDTYVQIQYSTATDACQIARDAFGATKHIGYNPSTIPKTCGATGIGDFRNNTAKQLLETAMRLAGPGWFWHVDDQLRGWFQHMGSYAVYTLSSYNLQSRTSSSTLQGRKNDVLVVGGTVGGVARTARYTGPSQSVLGIRSLSPPLNLPGVTDQSTLDSIAASVGATMDRSWNRVDLKILRNYGKRIHAARPGGATIRYWEPNKNPMAESETESGTYSSTFIGQASANSSDFQDVTAGDIPLPTNTDLQEWVNTLLALQTATKANS